MTRQLGDYVKVYLSQPIIDYLEEMLADTEKPVATWIRERVFEVLPPDVRKQADALLKNKNPGLSRTERISPGRPPPSPPPPEPSFEDLVEANRDRVLDLEARGYSASQIGSVTKLQFKLIEHILSTKAPPKKGRPT